MSKRAMMLVAAGLVSIVLLVGCKTTGEQPAEEEAPAAVDSISPDGIDRNDSDLRLPADVNLTIVATGNIYEALVPENIVTGESEASSMAHVNAYARQIDEKKDSVVLLDSGGFLHGSVLTDLWQKTDNRASSITADLLSALGYNTAALQTECSDLFAQTDFPWLSALEDSHFSSSTIIEKQGMRLGVCVGSRKI